ncbi:RluA family pseudouridine synthase [Sutcliffiella horikoshii]|uniref:RluA family pseudouridine synthase n=1 Tax=Sutcliffiella horikoshii TaxID=79883 RepID=UPI001CC140FB|nr:RluA family pseudouridine synthase [Sutcliffiella horikoshii]UAL48408.1 RluA family pseudouridine synthase [Sutcliffiella horikoshii]
MNNQMLTFCVTNNRSLPLQSYLKDVIGIPKGHLHELRMSKQVLVNGENPNWTNPLKEGDQVFVPILPEEISPIATEMDIEIIYETEHLLVVNKEAGMDTHPSSDQDFRSLSNGVAYYFKNNGISSKVRHVHRLDQDTSGAILFAKHAISGAILDRMLEERKVKRTYLALVEGIMSMSKGTLDKPIGKDRHHASRRRVSPNGQKAITHFKVVKTFQKEQLTLVELTLDTGRTHQIRVHMSSIGHPIYGDKLYGSKNKHHRHSLHAWKLTVPHPFKEKSATVHAPVPTSFGPSFLKLEEL